MVKAKHLKENLSHQLSWKISLAAPENKEICKILKASEIALKDQVRIRKSNLKSYCSFIKVLHKNCTVFNSNFVYIEILTTILIFV